MSTFYPILKYVVGPFLKVCLSNIGFNPELIYSLKFYNRTGLPNWIQFYNVLKKLS